MDEVMTGTRTFHALPRGLLATLLLCVPPGGCARMKATVRPEPPLLGTAMVPADAKDRPEDKRPTPSMAKARAAAAQPTGVSARPDAYAQSIQRMTTRPPESEQARSAESTLGNPDTVRDPAAPPADTGGIMLEPPTSTVKSPNDQARLEKPRPATEARSATPTAASLVAASRARIEPWTSYQVELNRQERVGGSLQEAEDVILSIRREPRAVRLEWPEGPHRGREVLYSATETNGLMQVNMVDSAIPMPRLSLPPDSPLILRTSRHPITEAGFETILANLQKTIDENGRGDQSHGRISYDGLERPHALDQACHKISRVTSNGEIWQVYLDSDSILPVMVEAHSASGELLERYHFRSVTADPPLLASADAFDPNKRWGEQKGLFGRLARSPGTPTAADRTTR
jgi:hypothetical protein